MMVAQILKIVSCFPPDWCLFVFSFCLVMTAIELLITVTLLFASFYIDSVLTGYCMEYRPYAWATPPNYVEFISHIASFSCVTTPPNYVEFISHIASFFSL